MLSIPVKYKAARDRDLGRIQFNGVCISPDDLLGAQSINFILDNSLA